MCSITAPRGGLRSVEDIKEVLEQAQRALYMAEAG